MGINQSYLFVFLLASLSTLCTSDCPTTSPGSINQTFYQECAKLYAVLEAALLENPANLYQLHYRFFPSSSIETLYAQVSFKLNDQHNLCWTSSVVLRSVDPSIIVSFQVLLLNILLPIDTSGQRAGVASLQLSIEPVNFTESDYPDYNTTIDAVLQDFTSLLKVYASTQRSRSQWTAADFKYEGYTCDSDSTLGGLLVSIAILTVVLTTLALIKAAPKFYEKLYTKIGPTVNRNEHWYSFFWAASFVATLCNIYALLKMLHGLILSAPDRREYFRIYVIKVVTMSLLIILDILVACCIPKPKEFPTPKLVYILSFPLCCTFWCCSCHCHTKESSSEEIHLEEQNLEEPQSKEQHSKKQCSKKQHSNKLCSNKLCSKELRLKWIQALALSSLFFFTQIASLSVLSTILRAIIFPVRILAAIFFLAAGVFCVTVLIALLLRNIGQITCSKKCCSLKETSYCSGSCKGKWWSILQPPLLILMVTLFLAIVILTFYVYIKLITSGIETNPVGGFIFTFLPSAILTIIGWFVTKSKFIEQLFPQEKNPQSDPQNQNKNVIVA